MVSDESVPEPEELQAFGVGVGTAVANGDVKNADAGATELLDVGGRKGLRMCKHLHMARRADRKRAEHIDDRRSANQFDRA